MSKNIVYFLAFIFLCTSCIKEPQHPSWETDISAPLFKSTMGLQHFFPDSILESDAQDLLHIVYRNILYDYTPDDIFDTPDTVTYQSYQSPFSITLQPGQLFLNKNEEKVFKFGQSKIASLKVKSGLLRMEIMNTLQESILMTYTISSATKNGQPLVITELVPPTGTSGTYDKSVDISGYTINMRGSTGLSANTISTNLKARINPDGQAAMLSTTDQFNTFVRFADFTVAHVTGYFEPVNIDVNDSTKMDVFSIIKDGQFSFEDVKIFLNIENGFGMDARLKINEIVSKNTATGQSLALTDPIVGHTINVGRASETGSCCTPVLPVNYPIYLNASNVKQMLELQPNRLTFNIAGLTNPLGNISGGNDFYYDGYGLKIHMNLDIPIVLKAHNLTIAEYFDFSMEKQSDYNRITQGSFQLVTDNGFPFDAKIQILLIDSNDVVIDSLLSNNVMMAAPLDQNLIVEAKKRTLIDMPMPAHKIDKLYDTKKMQLKIIFNTENNVYLKIYSHYNVDVKLTGHFSFLIKQ